MQSFIETLIANPHFALLVGIPIFFLICVIGFLIYKLLQKDIKGLSKDIAGLSKEVKKLSENMDLRFGMMQKEVDLKFSVMQKEMNLKFSMMQKEMNLKFGIIKELLSNHVTDTNKKIDHLETEIKEIKRKLDQLLNKKG